MTSWSLLELSPEPSPPMSGGREEIEALRHHEREVEDAIDDLNRQITAAIVAEIQSGGLSAELVAIVEARDLIRARIARLEGTQHG